MAELDVEFRITLLLAGFFGVGLVPEVVGQHGMVGDEDDAAGGADLSDVAALLEGALVKDGLAGVVDTDDKARFAFTQGGVGIALTGVNFCGG